MTSKSTITPELLDALLANHAILFILTARLLLGNHRVNPPKSKGYCVGWTAGPITVGDVGAWDGRGGLDGQAL
jgi:hypothetical protein